MIAWATVKPALVAWAKKASGLSQVVWKNEPAVFKQHVYIVLEVVSVTGYDEDDVTTTEVTLPGGAVVLREAVSGQRSFNLKLSVVTRSQRPIDYAENPLDLLRVRAKLSSCSDLLDAVNTALASFGEHVVEDGQVDDRWWSIWSATLLFNAGFNYTDTDNDSVSNLSWIQFVEGTAEVPTGTTPVFWETGQGDWEVQTTNAVATQLVPPLSVPSGVQNFRLWVTGTDTVSGALATWEYRVQVTPTELSLTTLSHFASPGTDAVGFLNTPSLVAGPSFRVMVVGGATRTVDWKAIIEKLQ